MFRACCPKPDCTLIFNAATKAAARNAALRHGKTHCPPITRAEAESTGYFVCQYCGMMASSDLSGIHEHEVCTAAGAPRLSKNERAQWQAQKAATTKQYQVNYRMRQLQAKEMAHAARSSSTQRRERFATPDCGGSSDTQLPAACNTLVTRPEQPQHQPLPPQRPRQQGDPPDDDPIHQLLQRQQLKRGTS